MERIEDEGVEVGELGTRTNEGGVSDGRRGREKRGEGERTSSRSLTRSGCFVGMCFLRKSAALKSFVQALHRNLPSASCLM